MNVFKTLSVAAVAALSLMSAASFAETISVTGSTLDDAEAKVATKASAIGATYKILEASSNNLVHMTAKVNN
ncbi:DUF1471 domain-containing protein [Enterobacteriaceae bacterium RIT711]|nr:DUF1471 domain-containing protein [Enterobacteriaceae bacterium RIT711]